jgi:hypothetical protein
MSRRCQRKRFGRCRPDGSCCWVKLRDVELAIRGRLRGFGLKVGQVSKGRNEARIRELVMGHPVEPVAVAMPQARASLRAEYGKLHRMLLQIVRDDVVCRRLMTAPGVGEATT